jgi:predicted glycosyltransferase
MNIPIEGEEIGHDFFDLLLKDCGDSIEYVSKFSVRLVLLSRCKLEHRRGLAEFISKKRPDLTIEIHDILESGEADELIAHIENMSDEEMQAAIYNNLAGKFAEHCNSKLVAPKILVTRSLTLK